MFMFSALPIILLLSRLLLFSNDQNHRTPTPFSTNALFDSIKITLCSISEQTALRLRLS